MAERKPPTDFREKLAYMVVGLVVLVLVMIYTKPELTKNDGFMLRAQAMLVSGFIGGVVAWAYSQGKSTDEDRTVMREQARALVQANDPAWSGVETSAKTATVIAESATVVAPEQQEERIDAR